MLFSKVENLEENEWNSCKRFDGCRHRSTFYTSYSEQKEIRDFGSVSRFNIKFVTHQKDLMETAKSIDHDRPAQSAQSDHGRNFSLLTDYLCVKR